MNTPTNLPIAEHQVSTHDLIELSMDWTQAARQIWDLRKSDFISELQWQMILDWLVETEFDDESYLAGEIAYSLISDRAPLSVQNCLQVSKGAPPKCRLSFTRVNPTLHSAIPK